MESQEEEEEEKKLKLRFLKFDSEFLLLRKNKAAKAAISKLSATYCLTWHPALQQEPVLIGCQKQSGHAQLISWMADFFPGHFTPVGRSKIINKIIKIELFSSL